MRLGWLDQQPERVKAYEDDKAAAWHAFYKLPPNSCARYISMALEFLTTLGESEEKETDAAEATEYKPILPTGSTEVIPDMPSNSDWSD